MTDEKSKNQEKVDQLLKASGMAKHKLLADLVSRVAAGEVLKGTEYGILTRLENELMRAEPGEEKVLFEGACVILGCSKRTLHMRMKRGEIIQQPDGTFRKSELEAYKEKHLALKQGIVGEDLRKAELRYRQWKAEREELIVKQMKGQLIPIEEVERQFTLRAYELTRGLLFLSRRIAHDLAGSSKKKLKDCIEKIDGEVYLLLDRYSRAMAIGDDVHNAPGGD